MGYAFMAIVVSLVCNFSYLLLLVSSQSDTGNQRSTHKRYKEIVIEKMRGSLALSGDGYGYIVSEDGDSIFVDHRKVFWLGLEDGDELLVEASERRNFESEHLIMRRVLERNGEDFDYGALYRGSEQWNILFYQFLFYFVLSYMLLLVINVNGRNIAWWRYLFRGIVCVVILFVTYFISPVPLMHSAEVIPVYKSREVVEFVVVLKSCFVFVVVILYSRISTLLSREQQVLLENEILRNENLTTKYNMLASQVNPHFLFNSLSSLSMLVREKDEERALKYIDQLAYTFRYLSQNGSNSNFVDLRQEIEFAKAYTYLFKIRYADKISFEFDVEDKYLGYKLPAISLQPLIGNAVKHNTITSKRPLNVHIRTENGYLVVSNEKYPMIEPSAGTGIGLSNLNSRYQLLLSREIEIIDNDKVFEVRLPLEEPDK